MKSNLRNIKIIAGPTCSGKSDLAIDIATRFKGVIINADSLQVYRDLPILTAQTDPLLFSEYEKIPHYLYGFLKYTEKINAVRWAKLASNLIKDAFQKGYTPIIVGGTGMYINILINGFSNIPIVSDKTRNVAIKLGETNYKRLCDIVYDNDKELQKIIKPEQNRQMIRAYEILLETGFSIRFFFEKGRIKFLEDVFYDIHITDVERSTLYKNIDNRFRWMINNGAIDEVRDLLKKTNNCKEYPIFQAIGATEIYDYLHGVLTKDDMIEKSCRNSRRYAKRQITWFKNQINPFGF
ncbi:MAG: tRNA (adenosine(37)-N6)-dimethylallyltransferase MiaA [Holosporales bacterium]|jgi:tRNA dimethylallyltransferase|nr:tRNA (adenosine(37)-N6)-dimethylallyltransferase MiaA [Holosporales bacterium]